MMGTTTNITFQLGVLMALGTIVFSAGTFYMMGLFNNKKLDKMGDQLSNLVDSISKINDKVTNVQINQARTDEKLISLERQYERKVIN